MFRKCLYKKKNLTDIEVTVTVSGTSLPLSTDYTYPLTLYTFTAIANGNHTFIMRVTTGDNDYSGANQAFNPPYYMTYFYKNNTLVESQMGMFMNGTGGYYKYIDLNIGDVVTIVIDDVSDTYSHPYGLSWSLDGTTITYTTKGVQH